MDGTREITQTRVTSDSGEATTTSNIFEKPVFYWIDQICINQDDLIERSDQVRIMDKIYKKAKMVLIWLGREPTMIEAARRLRDEKDDDHRAIGTLLSHPYFSRIWTIQEVALSVNQPLMICGGVELGWDLVSYPMGSSKANFPWHTVYKYHRNRNIREMRTLEDCISLHYESDCNDPRDNVYGLLGLTPERWRVPVDYTKEVLEVYLDAVAALHEELFDFADPACHYPAVQRYYVDPQLYRDTLIVLARTMGFSRRQFNGLFSFFEYIQGAYLSTEIRNIRYTYTGRIHTRVRSQSSSEGDFASEEEEVEVSWGTVTATRRNPLVRDIIPEMGLRLASTTAGSTAERNDDSVQVGDRWWCKHKGVIHYFECPERLPDMWKSERLDNLKIY